MQNKFSWVAQVLVVIILGQTLFFKFTDSQETIALFKILGLGAVAYKSIGALELLACILLLVPRTITLGAILTIGLMSGAIMGHITKIGFEGAYGQLGAMAMIAWALSLAILWIRRKEIPLMGSYIKF